MKNILFLFLILLHNLLSLVKGFSNNQIYSNYFLSNYNSNSIQKYSNYFLSNYRLIQKTSTLSIEEEIASYELLPVSTDTTFSIFWSKIEKKKTFLLKEYAGSAVLHQQQF